MTPLSEALGINIRNARQEIGLSQENLALKAAIDRSYMSRIERGKANLSVEVLYKIAGEIGIRPHALLP